MMEAFGGSHQPSFKAKLRPAAGLCQHGASPDDEQRAHVLVIAFAEPAKYRSVACGELFRHQPEPGSEVAPLGEAAPFPIVATTALAVRAPIPGTLISRRQPSSWRASA